MARQIVFTDSGFWKYSWAHLVMQGSRLILPTGRSFVTNFLSWSHEHIIWSQFIYFKNFCYNIWLKLHQNALIIIVYSYMVTKVFNI